MKIGVQTYTIRDYLKTPSEINTSLKRIKDMGFNMVQLSGLGPVDIDDLTGMLKENEIEACGTHSPWDRVADPKELDRLIEEHKKLGCIQIGIGMKPQLFPDTYQGYTDFIKKTNEICAQTGKAGLKFGYHNHELEFMKFNGKCAKASNCTKNTNKISFNIGITEYFA